SISMNSIRFRWFCSITPNICVCTPRCTYFYYSLLFVYYNMLIISIVLFKKEQIDGTPIHLLNYA
ncbi:MAG TPA: hypothetical protein PLJ82_04715, partial [Paludibacteraceae bacterium]|nr:hypothetical protein [Paludibacteraceae bacterium]